MVHIVQHTDDPQKPQRHYASTHYMHRSDLMNEPQTATKNPQSLSLLQHMYRLPTINAIGQAGAHGYTGLRHLPVCIFMTHIYKADSPTVQTNTSMVQLSQHNPAPREWYTRTQ
jgi:hypothetical protein